MNYVLLPCARMCNKGLSNHVDVCLSVHLSVRLVCPSVDKNIENTNNQLKYVVICSEKGIITMFELFLKVIALIARYTISGSFKSRHFFYYYSSLASTL